MPYRRFDMKRALRIAALLLATIGVAAGAPPYRPSDIVADVTFDFTTHDRRAPGSDNWPITWADDDYQYTAWGDGGGFGGSNNDARTSNGFARIQGNYPQYRGQSLAGGKDAPNPSPFTGKCYGLTCVEGALYAWRTGDGSGETAYRFQQLWESADHGATWAPTEVRFAPADSNPPTDRGFALPTFLQFGKDNSDARDAYVYTYAANIKTDQWRLHFPGELTLLRAPERALSEKSAYEFFAGHNEDGYPAWVDSPAQRRPVWQDKGNGVLCASACHVPGWNRYILIAEYSRFAQGNMGMYEAPEPWGPWRTVLFVKEWGKGHVETSTFFWNFCPKWFSEDGLDFVLAFTGTGSNDSWNTVTGRFTLNQ